MARTLSPAAIERCLSHLDREEGFLRELLAGLVALHETVRNGRAEQSFTIAQRHLSRFAEVTTELDRARGGLRLEWAAALHVPHDQINLTVLADRLPEPAAGRVRAAGRRLRELADEIAGLRDRCAALLAHCRVYLQRLRSELIPGGGRYGPAGTPVDISGGARFVTRG